MNVKKWNRKKRKEKKRKEKESHKKKIDCMSFKQESQTPFTHELVKRHLSRFFFYSRFGKTSFKQVFLLRHLLTNRE
jgi:hypothetical protein